MSDKKMLDDQINIAIAQKTAALVDKSDIRRSELARSLSIAAPTVTQMLSGITPLLPAEKSMIFLLCICRNFPFRQNLSPCLMEAGSISVMNSS